MWSENIIFFHVLNITVYINVNDPWCKIVAGFTMLPNKIKWATLIQSECIKKPCQIHPSPMCLCFLLLHNYFDGLLMYFDTYNLMFYCFHVKVHFNCFMFFMFCFGRILCVFIYILKYFILLKCFCWTNFILSSIPLVV